MTAVTPLVADENTNAGAAYSISVSAAPDRIRGFKGAVCLADSTRALVFRETHQPPVYYIPRDDVAMEYLTRTDFRTFCPFKGNASHWSLDLDGTHVEPAAWSYEQPLMEGEPIKDHIAFYGDAIDKWMVGDRDDTSQAQPVLKSEPKTLLDWLIRGSWNATDLVEMTKQLGDRLLETGIPVVRLNVAMRQLHPLIAGRSYVWQRGVEEIEQRHIKHSSLDGAEYLQSPMKLVSEGLGGIRRKLNVEGEKFEFPILEELRDKGATDYVALPLRFSDGVIHNLTLTSDHPNGFSTSDLGQIFEALPLISRMYEVHKVKMDSQALLETYLGKSAGNKVLNGFVKRGDGEIIKAVIYYCDLCDSTKLTEELGQQRYLEILNRFFDASAVSVVENGGEVLKFIGDAILAIFPIKNTSEEEIHHACDLAINAARTTLDRLNEDTEDTHLECTIGLHYGDVMYGNVGSEDRLDFTVIGSAANEAARIGEISKQVGRSILVSSDVASHIPNEATSIGKYALKGVSQQKELFTIEPIGSR